MKIDKHLFAVLFLELIGRSTGSRTNSSPKPRGSRKRFAITYIAVLASAEPSFAQYYQTPVSAAGFDSIRRSGCDIDYYGTRAHYFEAKSGAQLHWTNTNRYERRITLSWRLNTGGNRNSSARIYNHHWNYISPCDGNSIDETVERSSNSYAPWNETSDSGYLSGFSRLTKPCRPATYTPYSLPPSIGVGIQEYLGYNWTKWNVSWSDSRFVPGESYTASARHTSQPLTQLTTGVDPIDADGSSYFWVYTEAEDLPSPPGVAEPSSNPWLWRTGLRTGIPVTSISVAGQNQSPKGRVLVNSYNNAPYDWMVNTTPTIASVQNYQFFQYPVRAEQKAGALAVATIRPNPGWPGLRPTGMLQRLGYTTATVNSVPSDDQILWDVMMNSPVGSTLNNVASTILSQNRRVTLQIGTSAGTLINSTVKDREWLTLAFLSRSVNGPPTPSFSIPEIGTYVANNQTDYRMFNEFMIKAVVDGDKFATMKKLRQRQDVGRTVITFASPITMRVLVGGSLGELTVPAATVNYVMSLSQFFPNDAGANNGAVIGGVNNQDIRHYNAAHAGPLLASVEEIMVKGPRPDFYSSLNFECSNDTIAHHYDLCHNKSSKNGGTCTWPTFDIYRWDQNTKRYQWSTIEPQADAPFPCFLTIWP